MDNKKVFDVDVYVHRKTNRKTHPQHEIYKFIEKFLFTVVVSNDSRHLHNFFQVHNNQQTGHRHFNLVTNYAHKKNICMQQRARACLSIRKRCVYRKKTTKPTEY